MSSPASSSSAAAVAYMCNRAMWSATLIVRMMTRPGHASDATAALTAFVKEMKADKERQPGNRMIDFNYCISDTGRTIPMMFVELVGSLIRVRASQLSFTRGSDDDFISTFRMLLPLYQADLTICDKHGMNVIHQLITYIDNLRSVEGVDANTQAHLVTVMKDLLSHDGRLLESRDANNRTVFLHLVHSRILAFGPLLALDPPPDVSVVDFDGNNMFHLLLRETSLSPLVYAFTYPTGFWCTRAIGILFHTNKDGLTAVELAAKDKQVNPMKQQMHLLMSAAARAWRESVVPFIMRELDNCMIKDVANICTEYLDGSGRPWQLPTSASLPSPTTTTE